MTAHIPDWAPYSDATLQELQGVESGAGRIVALVASPGAVAAGWTGEIAASLVRAWSGSGMRVVVADGGLERPTLHEVFGVGNREGLTDALLWGASVQKVARPLASDGFYVITAGTPVPDGAEAFGSERWRQLCDGFRDAGVTLVTLVPEGASGWESVVTAATDVFVLSDRSDDVGAVARLSEERLRGVLGKEITGASETSSEAPESPPDEGPDSEAEAVALGDDWVEAGWRDPEPALEEVLAGGPENAEREEAPHVHSARGPSRTARPRPDSGRRRWVIVALVAAAAIVAALLLGFGGFARGGDEEQGPSGSGALQAAPATGVLSAASPPVEESPLLAFSLAVGSYRDGAVAARRARNLAARVPGVLFSSVPVILDGTVYHRVLGGPARDSADAVRLAGVVSAATGLDPRSWVQRPTPRAFRLVELDDLDVARGRVDVLLQMGLPAYVLAVDLSDGTTRYRIYAGAYADETEASHLMGLLRERGLTTATLSDRIGRLPE